MSAILIYEHLCAAGRSGFPGEESLLREGRSMLCGLVEDFVAAGEDEVWTVWHASWGEPPFGGSVRVLVSDDCREGLQVGLRQVDGVILIAPESGGVLEQVTMIAEGSGCRLLGCSADAVRLAGDKWGLFENFSRRGIATVLTSLIDEKAWGQGRWKPEAFPCVLKPRYGAGSQETYLIRSSEEWERSWPELSKSRMLVGGICQPFVAGVAVSVGVWCDGEQGLGVPFPMARQVLSEDGRFQYRGGMVPSPAPGRVVCEALAAEACRGVPGLRGYVGVDLIVCGEGEALVVEINPRLTTSYLGYRRLVKGNLSGCWRRPEETARLSWKRERIRFDADGNCECDFEEGAL